jgi:hypothetical protein
MEPIRITTIYFFYPKEEIEDVNLDYSLNNYSCFSLVFIAMRQLVQLLGCYAFFAFVFILSEKVRNPILGCTASGKAFYISMMNALRRAHLGH